MTKREERDEYDWIETVVKLGEFIGLNPVRTRWKLRAWQDRMARKREGLAEEAHQVTRRHKTCSRCNAINAVEDKRCHNCGARLHSRPVDVSLRFLRRFDVGLSAETFLALAFIAVYALVAIKGPGSGWISQSSRDLIAMGGNYGPAVFDGQWYRLWTSVLMHGGIWHVGFNVYALLYIAPLVREVYGSNKTVFSFVVTGVLASCVSLAYNYFDPSAVVPIQTEAGVFLHKSYPVGIGASGAICGLIGMAAAWGHRDGTSSGINVRNSLIRWIFYILVFGYFIGADNAAHIGGLAAGAALSFALPASWNDRQSNLELVLGAASWLAVAAGVAMVAYLAFTAFPIPQ